MTLFLFSFFLIYGSGHLYLFRLLRSAWPQLAPAWTVPALLWCLLMTVAPVAVRLLERHGHDLPARLLALTGYCWMGWLFLFCSLAAVLELLRGLRHAACYLVAIPRVSLLQPRPLALFCLLAATGIVLWGWFEALNIRTEQVRIPTATLSAGSRIRIVQISDLHVGVIVREERVRRVIEAIRQAQPDLIVSTGDLVDGNLRHFDGVSTLLRQLAPPLGMVAIPGNHEYYVGFRQAQEFTEKSGFRLLRSEAVPVGERLWVVGVDDPVGQQVAGYDPTAESRLLARAPRDRFVLVLKHRPEVATESRGRFDLQLSGHVHKGQIFPFTLLTRLRFPLPTGTMHLTGGGWLHVSRGTGTWGPPIRFLAPPEITVIDLVPEQQTH
ncbi:metallophosphoesterase [Trichlorobacter ammonificans]|uniref:Metallophosphoesterase n=1 Tax=Trichlorobacter ammonificans TaxID=2916410 RepID=A0ABM9D5J8_9BACT|nr:metallophosphoesterase [Trichlorobacter ammonificans]CAH2030508.1 Metallophosphoesterase [Trichlorobacter ammonificans]